MAKCGTFRIDLSNLSTILPAVNKENVITFSTYKNRPQEMVVYSIKENLTGLGRYITNIHTSSCLLNRFIAVLCVFS